MRLPLLVLCASLICLPQPALAAPEAGGSFIGLFADAEGTFCSASLTDAFEYVTIYVLASLNPDHLTDLEAARFRLDNLPPLGTGNWTASWNAPTSVSGELDTGVLIEWGIPLAGPLVVLGNVEFWGNVPDWIGADHTIAVDVADDQTEITVRSGEGTEFRVNGGAFTFNCSGECLCAPSTSRTENSWGAIKILY